jgi:hypothetical protein
VACELAETVQAGNPGHQLGPVIFDARRVRLLDRCFDHREQISNSVIEFAEQKSHAVFVQTEFSTLSSHLSLRLWLSRYTRMLSGRYPAGRRPDISQQPIAVEKVAI